MGALTGGPVTAVATLSANGLATSPTNFKSADGTKNTIWTTTNGGDVSIVNQSPGAGQIGFLQTGSPAPLAYMQGTFVDLRAVGQSTSAITVVGGGSGAGSGVVVDTTGTGSTLLLKNGGTTVCNIGASASNTREVLIGSSATVLGIAGFHGIVASGTTGGFLQMQLSGTTSGLIFTTAAGLFVRPTAGVTLELGSNNVDSQVSIATTGIVTCLAQLRAPSLRATAVTVATLPAAATAGQGARLFVTDALAPVFGAAVAAGGAVNIPVFSTGAAWNVG